MDSENREPSLTPRQAQCLEGRINHMSAKEVGRLLSISPHTVAMHWRHARWKLGTSDTLSAAKAWQQREQRTQLRSELEKVNQLASVMEMLFQLLAAVTLLVGGLLSVLMILALVTLALDPRWLATS